MPQTAVATVVPAVEPEMLDAIAQAATSGIVSAGAFAAALGMGVADWIAMAAKPEVREAMALGRGRQEYLACVTVTKAAQNGDLRAAAMILAAHRTALVPAQTAVTPYTDKRFAGAGAAELRQTLDSAGRAMTLGEADQLLEAEGGLETVLDHYHRRANQRGIAASGARDTGAE